MAMPSPDDLPARILPLVAKGVIAGGVVALLCVLADWRMNGRMDRSGLERLTASTSSSLADPVTTGGIGRRAHKH